MGAELRSDGGAPEEWEIRAGRLSLGEPRVMGILNVTPDSFSDGGELATPQAALDRAARMVEEGADLLDVGGESTRPGAAAVPAAVQAGRVVPVVELLAKHLDVPISVDTRDALVAREALGAGAHIVNDVSALGDPAMAAVVAQAGAGLVLMHMRGEPADMQRFAAYDDVIADVRSELGARLARATAAGVPERRIVLDPGIGFAKTLDHNLSLLGRLAELAGLGRPLLVGPSRKAFIGRIAGGAPPRERGAGTLAACVVALLGGARLFRVHDVALVRQGLNVAEAIRRGGGEPR
jgi:dihydropteroate synthase